MNAENTVITETLLAADAIAFYIWVLGVAITGIWKKADTGDWVKLSFELLGYIILAMAIAFIVVHWFGPNGVVALAVIFLAYHIVRVYLNIRHLVYKQQ